MMNIPGSNKIIITEDFLTPELRESYILACEKQYRKHTFLSIIDKVFDVANWNTDTPWIFKGRSLYVEYRFKNGSWVLHTNGYH
jgi:hypothetical protein